MVAVIVFSSVERLVPFLLSLLLCCADLLDLAEEGTGPSLKLSPALLLTVLSVLVAVLTVL
jgi:hypothetical protein